MADTQYPQITGFLHIYGIGYFIDYTDRDMAVSVGEQGEVQFAEGIGNERLNMGTLQPSHVRRFEFDEQTGLVSIVFGMSDILSATHVIGKTQKKEAAQAWVRDVNKLYESYVVERTFEAENQQSVYSPRLRTRKA